MEGKQWRRELKPGAYATKGATLECCKANFAWKKLPRDIDRWERLLCSRLTRMTMRTTQARQFYASIQSMVGAQIVDLLGRVEAGREEIFRGCFLER